MQRDELIRSLASTMGMTGEKKKEASDYDPTTGTLYIGSHVYQAADIERARKFCEENARKMESRGDGASTLYTIAAIAIEMMEERNVSNGGKVVVQDKS